MTITRSIHRWHRRIGIASALIVLFLSVSGVLLNHTGEFRLEQHFVKNKLVLDWYNIGPPEEPVSFKLGQVWLTRIGDRLYFNDKELDQKSSVFWGLARQQDMLVLALEDKLLLLNMEGQKIELLSGYDGVPAGIKAIGMNEYDELVIRAAHGDYLADLNALAWEDYEELAADWSTAEQPPAQLQQQLLAMYRGKGLSWERLLLDMHSGRLFGDAGVYVIDLVALLFIFLALSGSWMWLRRR
jgi:PepSY-associated transmembrane protein